MTGKKAAERTVLIDGVVVDMDAVTSISHDCRPELCKDSSFCCSCYEVSLSEDEMPLIVGLLPAASAYAKGLGKKGRYENVFDEADPEDGEAGLFTIDTAPDGSCVFAYRDASARPLCSLHTAALAAGLPPYRMKPKSCTLWPLAISEDTPPVLSIQDDAFSFPCNRRKRPSGRINEGIEDIIRELFGTVFLERLRKEVVKTKPVSKARNTRKPGRGG